MLFAITNIKSCKVTTAIHFLYPHILIGVTIEITTNDKQKGIFKK